MLARRTIAGRWSGQEVRRPSYTIHSDNYGNGLISDNEDGSYGYSLGGEGGTFQ